MKTLMLALALALPLPTPRPLPVPQDRDPVGALVAEYEKAESAAREKLVKALRELARQAASKGDLATAERALARLRELDGAPAPVPGQPPGAEALPAGVPKSLAPGLQVTEYPRLREQDKEGVFVALQKLGAPIGEPAVTSQVELWTHHPERNAVARGFLQVKVAGEYAFNANADYDNTYLLVAGREVCPFHDGEKMIGRVRLAPGLVEFVSVGLFGDRGKVRLLWQPPGQPELGPIPPEQLFHRPFKK